jgi:ABC-type Zn uptake system ZnuABC Zn-binding protein ZnuA
MKKTRVGSSILILGLVLGIALPTPAAAAVEVVTTLPAYASIAKAVGGDRVEVAAIASGDEDAHFVKAKPSYALMLRDADLFVTTGLDLELWAPALVDKSGNRKIRDGQPGFVSASRGVPMMDVPDTVSRAAGDVHIYGNPHIHTSPLNAKIIAGNIAAGLKRVDPAGAAVYDQNLARFRRRIDVALYGEDLLEVLDARTLDPLAREGKLIPFLESKRLGGEPLTGRLGGWLGTARRALYGEELVTYHKNWIYFTTLFGLEVLGYVEPKPGIPPSARHVHELIQLMAAQKVRVLLAASYFSRGQVEQIGERTGATPLIVPLGPSDLSADGYLELVDLWVRELARAYGEPSAATSAGRGRPSPDRAASLRGALREGEGSRGVVR